MRKKEEILKELKTSCEKWGLNDDNPTDPRLFPSILQIEVLLDIRNELHEFRKLIETIDAKGGFR